MGEAAKRRTTDSRGRGSKAKSKVETRRTRGWIRLVTLLGTSVLALYSLVSVGAYYLTRGESVRRPTGLVGEKIAEFSTRLFGWSSLVPLIVVLIVCIAAGRRSEEQRKSAVVVHPLLLAIGAIVGALSIAVLASLADGRRGGGGIGFRLAMVLEDLIGVGGTVLLAAVALMTAFLALSQTSWRDLRDFGKIFLTLGFVATPTIGARLSLGLGRQVGRALACTGRLAGRCIWKIEDPHRPEQILPTPRVRKNILKDEPKPVEVPRSEPLIVKPRAVEVLKARGSKITPSKRRIEEPERAYTGPDVSLLTKESAPQAAEEDDELRQKAECIESKLRDFGILGRVTQVHPGPVITLFEFEPAPGVKVSRIAALQDDLAMALRASSIRIIAPIPNKNTAGIEVPNRHRNIVRLRECLESDAWIGAESTLSIPLGKDTYGESIVVDIANMPHLLMAGATGTGKSVCINAILLSLLYRATPSELGLILIDPKVLELSIYDSVPHLRVPVVTDPKQARAVLSWAVKEMDRRYRYMQRFGVRNVDGYNKIVSGKDDGRDFASMGDVIQLPEDAIIEPGTVQPEEEARRIEPSPLAEELKALPKIVIVIDELADLMLQVGREIEELITRLAQKARAAGIHLIVATQRPSVDVITGLIKANFPARLSFRVSSRIDSRTILDQMGAEKLLGKGDMLFMLPGAVPLKRVHGAFVSDQEVQRVVAALKENGPPQYDENIIAAVEKALSEEGSQGGGGGEDGEGAEYDPFYDKAVELVIEKGQASTSMIQRTFRIGYNRAARIIEMMERDGVVGPMDGVKPREVLTLQARESA